MSPALGIVPYLRITRSIVDRQENENYEAQVKGK